MNYFFEDIYIFIKKIDKQASIKINELYKDSLAQF